MKSKRLLCIWSKSKYTLCGIVLQSFLCTALWANDKDSPSGTVPAIRKTTGLTDRVIKGQITDDKGASLDGVTITEKGTSNAVL